jgi:hypothetical protein
VAFEVEPIGERLGDSRSPSGEERHSTAEAREVQMAPRAEIEEGGSGIARKLIVPTAITAAGSAVGLLLTKREKLREAAPRLRQAVSGLRIPQVPQVPAGGVGELAGDLRGKLDDVLGKEPAAEAGGESRAHTGIDRSEFQQRRRAREERRSRRRQRSRR